MKDHEILYKEFAGELTDNILNYWATKVYDPRRKIFFGLIGPDERSDPAAPCLLYTSDAADDLLCVDLGGRRIIKKKKKQKNQN